MIRIEALIIVFSFLAAPALADPCKAVPDKGVSPSYLKRGATFSGPVVYVVDGDGLCVDVGKPPAGRNDQWVEVRIADFYAPELAQPEGQTAKAALQRIIEGQTLTCRADHQIYDRIAAVCTIQGKSVGDLMRQAGVKEGGKGRGGR